MNRRIRALLAVHCVLGIFAASLSANQQAVSSAVLLALVLCQSTLLGMWGGLSHSYWVLRLCLVVVGTFYLFAELGLGIGELQGEIFVLVAMPTLLVGVTCWVIRLATVVLRTNIEVEENMREGLQFSIRHLMQLTLVVACLMTVGKVIAPWASGLNMLAELSALSACYAAVALTSLWAVLGLGRPAIRSGFVILIALTAGFAAEYIIGSAGNIFFWTTTTMLQAAMLLASLFVIRSIGYRIVAKSPTDFDANA